MSRLRRKGLTITECVVVIAIVVVLIGLFFPPVRRVRESAARLQCNNSLKQVILALHTHSDTARLKPTSQSSAKEAFAEPHFPRGVIGSGPTPQDHLSWIVAILPYLENEALYQKFDLEKSYADNLPATQSTIAPMLCPEGSGGPITNFIAISGLGADAAKQPAGAVGNGFMGYDRWTTLTSIADGTSNTIALMETKLDVGPWARGGESTLRGFDPAVSLSGDPRPFGGLHAVSMSAAMADGSVRSFLYTVDPKILAAAITIAGGEQVDLEQD